MAITAEERAHRKAVKSTRPCDRCGAPRKTNGSRTATGLCRDCLSVDPLCFAADLHEVTA